MIDFIDYGFNVASAAGVFQVSSAASPLTLVPGARAVYVLLTKAPLATKNLSCVHAPAGGGLSVTLGGRDTIQVAVPTADSLVTNYDSPGSAFTSCAQVIVSPVMTWAQAKSVVGAPTPNESRADQEIYASAP
jgi:hypothetical protein